MLVPIKWLKKYVDINVDDKELAEKLTMSGSHVDSIINLKKDIKNIVVGKIISVEKHPHADKLQVTKVDIGNKDLLQIITAAKNIKVGDLIPIALDGAVLADETKIKDTIFRDLLSQGMMCSYQELGFDDKLIPKEFKDGILILGNEAEIGQDISKALDMYGNILDIEITFNRPDCLSIMGIAREAAATLNTKFKYPEIKIKEECNNIKDYFNAVEIQSEDLCDRFYTRVVKDVKVGPSPQWLQRQLMDSGMRPINNIVDITNYVMLELGQPLHAYDLDKLEGRKLVARRPIKGETLITLDKVERKLDEDMLIIADANRPVGIAGVMGGYDSEINEDTKTMLIESASFNSKSVRSTSKKLGLRSEASARNEKGLNYSYVRDACERVCQLIELLGVGKVVKGNFDVGKTSYEKPVVKLRPHRVEMLLGVKIEINKMLEILNKLEIESIYENDVIVSKIPYFRQDIKQEADLIEEVGRIYGFHNIESKPLQGIILKGRKSEKRETEDYIKDLLTGLGLMEITTYSFISPKAYNNICASENDELRKYIKLLNPLGEDYSIMRTTLIPNMLDVICRNNNRGVSKAYLYEIGNIFIPKQIPVNELPEERSTLCIGMYGECDFFSLKGIVEQIMDRLGIKFNVKPIKDNTTFHSGRTAGLYVGDDLVGIFGEIHPDVLEKYDINYKVNVAELSIEQILKYKCMERKLKALPKYPAVLRDIAIIVKDNILIGDMQKIIKLTDDNKIEEVKLFDIYKGDKIDEGYKSVAFSIKYRNNEKTLTDEEVNKIHQQVLNNLQKEFGAALR